MGQAMGPTTQAPGALGRLTITPRPTLGTRLRADLVGIRVNRVKGPGAQEGTPWDPRTMAVDSRQRCTIGEGDTTGPDTPILQLVEHPQRAGLPQPAATRAVKDILLTTPIP